MNKIATFILAQEIQTAWTEKAATARLGGLFEKLVSNAAPAARQGFRMAGAAADRTQGIPGIGSSVFNALGGNSAPSLEAFGRTALGRVGAGAAGAYGGAVGLEAPFKMHNNAQYAEQQAHPLRSWLAQHLMGQPKRQYKSLLNPFSA